jgi:hypothetical protein
MPRLKHPGGGSPWPEPRIPIELLLCDPLPVAQIRGLPDAERRIWLEVRSELRGASVGTEHDERHVLELDEPARIAWRARRSTWIRGRLVGDPRIRA